MTDRSSERRSSPHFEWIAAAILGGLAVGSFLLQMYNSSTPLTTRETALYNALQFLLTVGFTWFSTRAVSRNEFEASLKRFAISAYRRVADIERMIDRLHAEIGHMIRSDSPTSGDLRIVDAIVIDTGQVVRSSIADWADVIGEELLAIEQIKRLEQERSRLLDEPPEASNAQDAQRDINKQIAALLESLPPRLQLEAERSEVNPSVAEKHAAKWVREQHELQSGLKLTVVSGKLYHSNRDQETLAAGEKLFVTKTDAGALDVIDQQGNILGRLQNNSPLDYPDWSRAVEICYGKAPLVLEFLGERGKEKRGGDLYGWFDVRVAVDPIFDKPSNKG